MVFPHEKHEAESHGRSPGNGITPAPLSAEPLATEGEATPGPNDETPWDDGFGLESSPTGGRDPYAFDDIGESAGDAAEDAVLPGLNPRGSLPIFDF